MLILRKNAFRYIFTYFYFMKDSEKPSLSLPPLPKTFSRPGKFNRALKGPRIKTQPEDDPEPEQKVKKS